MRRLICIIPIISLLAACAPIKEYVEVPVETVKTEYIYNTKIDSVHVRDSVDRWIKGDTVFIYKEHTKFKYLNNTDTVIKVDSIPKIINKTITKEVEVNHIKWYQNLLMWIGSISIISMITYIIYKLKKL